MSSRFQFEFWWIFSRQAIIFYSTCPKTKIRLLIREIKLISYVFEAYKSSWQAQKSKSCISLPPSMKKCKNSVKTPSNQLFTYFTQLLHVLWMTTISFHHFRKWKEPNILIKLKKLKENQFSNITAFFEFKKSFD